MVTVNSHLVEFGYELIAVIPYAYWLHSRGELKNTVSGRDTKCLYYFSPNHEEVDEKRDWSNMRLLNVPNKNIHVKNLDKSRWLPPKYKETYRDNDLGMYFDLIITNKYATEWFGAPVNFIDCETLEAIFSNNQDRLILYNRLRDPSFDDHAKLYELADDEIVKRYDNVTTIQEVMDYWKTGYNETQVKTYANCERFISVQGGNAILASYFGGKNTIYIKRGQELKAGSYKWYKDLSGCDVNVLTNLSELKKIKI